MNCVAYTRVSDEKQTRGASLSDQETACREFAARMGWTVVAIYRDDGKSAWHDEIRHRPQFERMLAAAGSPRRLFAAVVVYNLARFARRARIFHNCRWQLEQAGVSLLSATEPNERTAAGRLSSGMLAEFAEFYSAQLSERIKAAHQGKAARGLWIGAAPFGYELGAAGHLVPNRLWLWVVCIFVAYREGATTVDLALALNAAGVPLTSGKPWTKDSVLMVLRNHAYIGKAGGRALEAYQAGHEPLITVDLWERVHLRLSEARKRPRGPRRSPKPAPLSYVPLCDLCSSKMHRSRSASAPYLRCRGAVNHTCPAKSVSLDLVEHQVKLLRQSGAAIGIVYLKSPRGIERFEAP